MVWQDMDISELHGTGWNADELGEGTVDLVPDGLEIGAEVLEPAQALRAVAAGNGRTDANALAWAKRRGTLDGDDLAREFVADGRGVADACRLPAPEDANISAADRRGADT
jgi:hypothetical protein